MSASVDMTVEGTAMSTVPSLSFCSISLSPPSWLEPYTTTFALPASFALARRANSSADFWKIDPGSPTWPSLSSVCAATSGANAAVATARSTRMARCFMMPPPMMSLEFSRSTRSITTVSAVSPSASLRRDASVISLVGFAHATSHFFHFVMPPLFPWLMRDFGLTFTQVGAAMTVFFVVSAFGQALAGFVVDRVGAFRVLCGGMTLLALSGLAFASVRSYPMLLAAAGLAGLGNSVFHPADYTLLNRTVSTPRLGHAFSVHGLSGSLGWAASPVFVLAVAEIAGWRAAGVGASLIAALALGLLLLNRRLLEG